ncbi:hypothetical protein PR202_ga14264 [Eleusine coracana subsp. coracana]|uniref:Uncharacterized protein n=1 Tax=Eleusine coracana subsp. coracana TaxID=191504 RepID=A0AAV5CG45_ELECO|nr:hypothetical protein PR202_ga14264 [Eleusine coracana subsp. coracana]
MAAMAPVAAARLPPAATRRLYSPLPVPLKKPRLFVASAHSNFPRVVQTAWRVGKDAVEAGTNLLPGSIPRPIARIGVTFAAVSIALFLVKSIVSTAFFVLAMMGLIYMGFLALNPKEVTGSTRADESEGSPSEDPVEEARRIMEKYK